MWKMIFSWIWDYLKLVSNALLKDGGDKLCDLALMVVSEFSVSNMTNDQKRESAFAEIRDHAAMAGMNFGESAIRLAIEIAVQKLKQTK